MQNTWLGKRVLNNFTWFYHSHLLMFVIFYIAAILHPWPGTPGYSHEHHHSVTWVRRLCGDHACTWIACRLYSRGLNRL